MTREEAIQKANELADLLNDVIDKFDGGDGFATGNGSIQVFIDENYCSAYLGMDEEQLSIASFEWD